MKLQVGEIIVFFDPNTGETAIPRMITEIRDTGYEWKYVGEGFGEKCPNGEVNSFMSENSNDPFFDWPGVWKKLKPKLTE